VRSWGTVRSGEAELAVFTAGDPANPPVLLVHGYPDTHAVWSPVAERLAERFHVIAHDVRGAGASQAPAQRCGYRLERLAADLTAVATAVEPDRPVHLAGHDWGAIQAWEAVTEPGAAARFASFTAFSGPCLDHVGHWMRRRTAEPGPRHLRQLLGQQLRSWYVALFQLPEVPEWLWRKGLARHWPRVLSALEPGVAGSEHFGADLAGDAVRGLELYRANIRQRLSHPRQRSTDVPVLAVGLSRDLYVSPSWTDDLDRWVTDLRRELVRAGHWAPVSHPGRVAELITGQVLAHEPSTSD